MKKSGSQTRETLKEAGYILVADLCNDCIVVLEKKFENYELWQLRNDFAGYVLEHKNKGYEFVGSLPKTAVKTVFNL